jgi:hypothetical protein
MQHAAHLALECLVNQLMLLNPGLALERCRDDGRRIVIAIAGKVTNRHLRIRNVRLDQPLDFTGLHSHRPALLRRSQFAGHKGRHPGFETLSQNRD